MFNSFGVFLALFSGCGYKGYRGDNADLYTVAINSVLWNSGHSHGADFIMDSEIKRLEIDEYGRTLFTYHESFYVDRSLSFSALIVAQYSSDGYVYYYEDCNYIIKEQPPYQDSGIIFGREKINYLKELNDWGKELDLSKCVKKKIERKKLETPTDSDAIKNKIREELGIEDEIRMHLYYSTNDNNGNYLVYGTCELEADRYIHFAAFVTADGEVKDWFEPQNIFDYNEELKEFKKNNGWTN